MSRVAKNPVMIPQGVSVNQSGQHLTVKGSKGTLNYQVHPQVQIVQEGNVLRFQPLDELPTVDAIAGTTRALVHNMVVGVSQGFQKELDVIGVGYRVQVQGKVLTLNVGYSHPVNYKMPEGITIETPTQTKIIVKGADKYLVGQVAAKLRAVRPPENYKGKGIRYVGERIILKETKKK